jgi:multidrug efflux system membrane fusion protein
VPVGIDAVGDRNFDDGWSIDVFRLLLSRFHAQGVTLMRRTIAIPAVVLIALLAIGGGLAATHRFPLGRVPPQPAAAPVIPVVAGAVESHDVPIYLRGVGTVIAYNTVLVRSQIQGQITKIAFTEGQTVHAGDLLAQIDPRPYQAQVDQVTATRDRDQAQLANAQANLGRYTQLGEKGWATPQLVETQTAQVAQLQSAIKADEALIEAANVQLGYTRLTSPIDGVTGVRQVDVGNIIHPTDPNGLVVVTQIEPISVIFSLPETDLPKIQQQMAKGPLTVLAYSQDDTIELDQGKLMLVDNEILQTTGTIRLKAEFPNTAHRLWPGELIDVWLLLDTRHNGLTVQASAVQQGQQGAFTYVINPDNTVAARPVKVAQISRGQALIDAGLTANEQVVFDGQYKLQAGSHVTILHGKAAEEAAAQNAQQNLIP